ncbi:MAG: hypothetical protein IJC51_01330, partial [Eggerthellaceae bacterium]|nr:hypothetical protein [Eggerthellaceae bacterium]
DTDLGRLANDYVDDPFYALELPVTKLVYRFENIPEGCNAATIGFYWTPMEDGKILLLDQSGLKYASANADDAPTDAAEQPSPSGKEAEEAADGSLGEAAGKGHAGGADETSGEGAGEASGEKAESEGADASVPNTNVEQIAILSTWAENEETVTLYLFGAAAEREIPFALFTDGSCEKELDGDITLIEREESSFARFALDEWTEESGVIPHDWYNAMVHALNYCEAHWSDGTGMLPLDFVGIHDGLDLTHLLMRWFEYRITVDPEQTLTNTVKAPLYPAINAEYDPAVYRYTYLLSPARTWSSFGTLDISITTPFYLIDSDFVGNPAASDSVEGILDTIFAGDAATRNNVGFERTTSGAYTFSNEGLPEGELAFSLSASETPRMKWGYGDDTILKIIIIVVMVGGIIAGINAGKAYRKKRTNR